jgi:hypothetical protein
MKLRHRLTYANVTASLALVMAVTGGGYALASHIGSNEITDNSIAGVDVRDRSLRERDHDVMDLPSRAFGRFNDGPVFTTNDPADILSLDVPAGNYLLLAKATVFVSQVEFECRLIAENDFDRAALGNISGQGREVLTLTLLHSSPGPFTASLQCPDNDASAGYQITDIKLHAIRIGRLRVGAG